MTLSTVTKNKPANASLGRGKSEVRQRIESLKVGQCLEIRDISKAQQNSISVCVRDIRKKTAFELYVHKVEATGLDIYRTA